jgi:phospholipid/cholesterol/gamma-HCH transport system permease protein
VTGALNPVLDGVAAIGRGVIGALRSAGAVALFALEGCRTRCDPPFYPRLFLRPSSRSRSSRFPSSR